MSTTAASAARPVQGLDALDDPDLLASYTQWQTPAGGARIAVSQLQLTGMHCAACASIIESTLTAQAGVLSAQVNAAAERLQLRWDPARTRISTLVQAIAGAGYGAAPDAAAPAREQRERERRQALWRLFVAAFLMMQVMMLATPIYVADPGDMSADLHQLLLWGSWVLSLPVMLFSAGPFFSSAWRQLRAGHLGMDVPVSLGLLVTFVASTGATFDPGGLFGHEVYFDSLTMFVSFLLAGRFLELRARHRVAQSLEQAMSRLPDRVERLEPDGSSSQVSPQRLRAGDLVRVFAGQAFPADGRLEQGATEADEALLSGESLPVPKRVGDELVAGSMNLHAPVLLRVLRVGADTRYEGIVQLMRSALTQRPRELRMADRIAGPFLWGVLLLAGLAALAWHFVAPERAIWVAVSVLIVTCPCALSLAGPSAWLAAAGALARRGILLGRLEALETLARVDMVVLDKTGTLTEDRLVLAGSWPARPVAALLAQAAALAHHSRHPMALALAAAHPVDEAAKAQWQQVQELPGRGLQARDAQGRQWRLGSLDWLGADPALLPEAQLAFGSEDAEGGVSLLLAFDEQLRPDAAGAMQALRAQGLQTLLLSGDLPARVERVARQAGVQAARGGVSPEGKLAAVAELQAQGRCVLMVGDGINDAPVLARADASLAMGQGALVAKAQADGIVLSTRLSDVVLARELALRTRRVIRQNLGWAAAYNAACIPLALLGYLPPWAAGIGMAASSLFVILNALRLSQELGKT
ncbi:cation-translocating P-type ATPase [Paucibacter sediminis]|uniref:Cation-translocating P-type ATPase n=1 Tax=Paucibacter sediminis TaxID=3019553 RepID=A0AA95NDE7_9BURK|nr:cation-translocating P-type ATPase [Paucibacter sp. S2-9]WIT11668.1 cation-translocating P-type ATPase [Paucibacter sp. S2-9]